MGANTALRDAADLARRIALAGGVDGVDQTIIGAYEASLRNFAKMAIELSWQGGMKSFGLKPVEQCERIVL
jgi:2-polyprenyl-6-methoxyphenol hydroxylase-like FAD-dependent oxidoreductase